MTEQELVSSKELAKHLGISRNNINVLACAGHLTRKAKGGLWFYSWPAAKDEYKNYLDKRKHQHHRQDQIDGMISQPFSDQNQILTPEEQRTKDIETLSIGQMIIDGLKKHIDGVENTAFHWARALNESIKARQSMLELLEAESKTLKYEDVELWVMNVSRQNRDVWLNFPQRISTEMANELGVDVRLMNDVLSRHVRNNLEKVANFPEHFGGAGKSNGAS